MAQWGRNDKSVTVTTSTTKETSNGAPIGTFTLVKAGGGATAHQGNTNGTRANTDKNLFGNTTFNAFITGKAVGVMGVDAVEMGFTTGTSNGIYRVTSGGSGYGANATVTLTYGGTSNVTAANSTVGTTGTNAGRVTALTANQTITGLANRPVLTIAAPAAINISANTSGFSNTSDTIVVATANSRFQVGDRIFYSVPTSNTPIAPLTGNTYYYISFANTTTIKLATTATGANIDITDARTTQVEVHTIRGDTATGLLEISGAKVNGVAHAGWVIRTEGTGGRAGRVQYETLVAMGSLGNNAAKYGTAPTVLDAADDNLFHDS
jgi:hypothetical protein